MKQVITTEKLPIKLWLDDIGKGAMDQARNLANLPFAFRHIAIMPDCHEGFGMPIGGVLATRGAVVPNAVGVDIGCGMCALQTNLSELNTEKLKRIMTGIRKLIPLGFKHHAVKQNLDLMPDTKGIVLGGIVDQEFENARSQVGTLGGGNHFIEIQKGSDNHIWIMVHSGSRNVGLRVAEHYNQLAKKICCKAGASAASLKDLAYLPVDMQESHDYLNEMQYCIDFAFANRKLMMDRILSALNDELDYGCKDLQFINIAHNYARLENHFSEEVIVHRKGATSARSGETGIIPGSQGTKSYVVRGKGNAESFQSCSHGAGRALGRRQAQRTLDLKEEIERLEKSGIIHAVRHMKDLDEAPGAYKDIDRVMEDQQELVDIVLTLTPLAVIKG